MPYEVAFFVAKRIRSNVRELEGALKRIIANAHFTGKAITLEFVKEAFNVVGIKNWQKYVKTSKEFIRPAEVDFLIGDASKAKSELNWKPKVGFKELVQLMVKSDIKSLQKIAK